MEHTFGPEDALKYTNGYKTKVRNREPIITQAGLHATPSQDMYFKGALFLNTLRGVIDDDARWWKLVRGFYGEFKYRNIVTEDVVKFFNARTGRNLTPIFDQYLRHTDLPTLELVFNESGTVAYRWKADVKEFAMPVKAGRRGPLADHPAHHRVEDDEIGIENRMNSRWRRICTTSTSRKASAAEAGRSPVFEVWGWSLWLCSRGATAMLSGSGGIAPLAPE